MQLERHIIGSSGQLEIYPAHMEQVKIPLVEKNIIDDLITNVKRSFCLYVEAQEKVKKIKSIFQSKIGVSNIEKTKHLIKWNDSFNMVDSLSASYQINNFLENEIFSEGFERLDKIALIFKGKSPSYAGFGSKHHRILKTQNLTGKGIDWSENKNGFVPNLFFNSHKCAKLLLDDILLSCDAHMDYAIGKNIDIVDYIPNQYSNGMLIEQHMIIIRPLIVNPYVLLFFLQSEMGYELIQQQIRGIGQLKPTDLGKIPIPKKFLNLKSLNDIEFLTIYALAKKRKSAEILRECRNKLEKALEAKYVNI